MCALKSRGMSAVCTWELRGIFFLTLLVLFVLFSHSTVLCAALFSHVCTVCTISNTPNFTNCVRTSSDHLPSHIFPRKEKKKIWFHVYTKKIEAKKTSRSTIFTWSVKGKLFLFCIYEFIWTYELIWYEFISFEGHVKCKTTHKTLTKWAARSIFRPWRPDEGPRMPRSLFLIPSRAVTTNSGEGR